MLKINTLFAGRYTILEKIGSGGMADVYKAKDTKLEREVAIKVLKQQLAEDEEFVSRFESEGQAAASLNNPNIISIYDVGNVGSTYYIVMELINGITLKEYIRRKGMLSARETMAISAQVAVGLRAAHAHHIVHRDIKPQNIILSRDGKVKVTDFGIARAVTDETKSVNNSTMGTVHYIAPEQAKGQMCDERSDIYSLGIVMYEMITGQVPFDKETSIAIALAHMNETMVPPSELNPDCPKALEQIIFRCTQKSRDRRYHNCTELLQDLKIAVANPLFNFELQEQENLLKSDTNVFAIGGMSNPVVSSTVTTPAKPSRETTKATMIVDDHYDDSEDMEDTIAYVGGNVPDEEEEEKDHRNPETTGFIADKRLFAEDDKEDEKTIFDKVIMIAGIVIGALIVCMIIYIIATLSGCTQKNSHKPSSAPTASVNTKTEGEPSTEEFIPLETIDKDKYDPEVDTIVPNVIGMTVQSATNLLRESDLDYKISSAIIYSDEYKLGQICKQSYEEGTIVKRGSTIVISMSLGTDKFEIRPDYVNGPLAVFKNDISSFGEIYDINYVKRNDDHVKANYIISITPSEGIVEAGAKIEVVYSAGPEWVSCPNLIGKTKTEALSILLNNALNMGSTSYVYSDEVDENQVISQQYDPGTTLKNGTTVNLVVSKGFELVEVPDVVGKTVEDAQKKLEDLGFVVETVTSYDKDKDPDTVLEQDLEPEQSVKKGETITLTVNRADTVIPEMKDSLAEEANEVLTKMGFKTELEFEETEDPNLNMVVKETSPKAGETLEPGETVTLYVYRYKAANFTITVTTDGNGTAKADAASVSAGTKVNLTATPNEGYKFKEWKVTEGKVTITDNSFSMPNQNLVILAVFEADEKPPQPPAEKTLTELIVHPMTDNKFKVGDEYTGRDMYFTAKYSDTTEKDVTGSSDLSYSLPDMNTPGVYEIIVTYKEGDITVTGKFEIKIIVEEAEP